MPKKKSYLLFILIIFVIFALLGALLFLFNISCGTYSYHSKEASESMKAILTRAHSEYNIEIDPIRDRSPLALIPNEEATIKFFIGPRSIYSLTGGIETGEDLENVAEGRPIELTVTLFCSISTADTFQQRKVLYDPRTRCSDKAEFKINPQLDAVKVSGNIGKLIFVVDANGMEIDVIQMDAIVGDPNEAVLANYSQPKKIGFQDILPDEIRVPDLILAFAPEENGRLPVILRPIHPELVALIRKELNESDRDFWKFNSGVAAKDMDRLVRDAYLALTALVEQKQEELQKIYSAKLSDSAGMLFFSDQDKGTALKMIGREGSQLYWRIFHLGDSALRVVMESIFKNDFEARWERPLRVRIISTNLYVPWQIIYQDPTLSDPIKPELFWGFRFQLGTTQLVSAMLGRTKTAMVKPSARDVVFGAWAGCSTPVKEDLVKLKGDDLREYLRNKLGGEVHSCVKKSGFITRVTEQAKRLKLVFLYGHGSSGSTLFIGNSLLTGQPVTISAPSLIGPYFKFTDKAEDLLTPRDFDYLSACVPVADPNPVFFKSQPIVILNACETGTAGMGTADNSGFIGALTRTGARAVIVTEAPVWSNFAHFFGRDLVEELLAGEDVQGALLKVRLQHLNKCKNPFGLYYSLYGNQAAYIKK